NSIVIDILQSKMTVKVGRGPEIGPFYLNINPDQGLSIFIRHCTRHVNDHILLPDKGLQVLELDIWIGDVLTEAQCSTFLKFVQLMNFSLDFSGRFTTIPIV